MDERSFVTLYLENRTNLCIFFINISFSGKQFSLVIGTAIKLLLLSSGEKGYKFRVVSHQTWLSTGSSHIFSETQTFQEYMWSFIRKPKLSPSHSHGIIKMKLMGIIYVCIYINKQGCVSEYSPASKIRNFMLVFMRQSDKQ